VTTRLADVMTPQPQTMHPDEPFVKALRLMHRHGFRHLPVVEHGRPLGVVSARDALDEDLDELRVDLVQRGDERD
jgi:CBS domain-containing protein